jgi:hypothetical protein
MEIWLLPYELLSYIYIYANIGFFPRAGVINIGHDWAFCSLPMINVMFRILFTTRVLIIDKP